MLAFIATALENTTSIALDSANHQDFTMMGLRGFKCQRYIHHDK